MKLALCMLLLLATSTEAQTFTGRVVDATDSLIVSGAQIRVDGARSARSDGFGAFKISGIAPGRHAVEVRMLGYSLYSDSLDFAEGLTITRDLYLTRVPRLLQQMVVKGRSMRVPRGFESVYQRGASGAGAFLTREQIDSLNPRDVVGLLHEVPFIHINANEAAPDRLTTTRCRGMLPGTSVSGQMIAVYFNGVPITDSTSLEEILKHLSPSSIQAVEVYNGSTTVPPIFQPACGAVAIWTR